MKNDCSVVKDLMPLYAEGLVGEETKEFIYEHCQTCEKCKGLLNTVADFSDSSASNDYKKEKIWNEIASKERKKKKRKYIFGALGMILFVCIIVFVYSFWIKGNTWFTEYEYTYTQITTEKSNFSENDIRAAGEEVKRYFQNNFDGCVLLYLSYDEETTINQGDYPETIVFVSDYYMLREPVAGDMNRMRKNWRWIVSFDKSFNEWKVIDYGYMDTGTALPDA